MTATVNIRCVCHVITISEGCEDVFCEIGWMYQEYMVEESKNRSNV